MILGTPRSKQPFLAVGKRVRHSTLDIPHTEKRYKVARGVSNVEQSPYDDPGGRLMSGTSKAYQEKAQWWEETGFSDNSKHLQYSPAELETTQPLVEAGSEATLKHKTPHANDGSALAELGARSHSGIKATSRSSIYVDSFNLALDTVLKDECHLFNSAEREVFDQWKSLDYEAQYLYVRLFLRKTSTWHRIKSLTYGDIRDPSSAVSNLQALRDPQWPSSPSQVNAGKLHQDCLLLDKKFRFADISETDITTLEEAISLLSLEELRIIAKEAKVQGKNKKGLLKAFLRMSRQQSGLSLVVLSKSGSGQTLWPSSPRKMSGGGESNGAIISSDTVTEAVKDSGRDRYYLRRILATTGSCIRLSLPALRLFERVHLIFYRTTEWTEKSLTTMILARISRRNFPQYIVSRSASIFTSRSTLIEFEAALRTQYRVVNILESSEAPKNGEYEEILLIFGDVYPRWKSLVETEQRKEDYIYENGESAYLRHFSPAWVYTRIIHKATLVLGKLKMHHREHQILAELLSQHLFHVSRRGAWYQRKALIEENYMAAITKTTTEDLASKKRYWKRVSLQTCEEGLQDRNCNVIYHYDLQKRIRKIEKNLKVPKREQHDFGHVALHNPVERTVLGILVKRTSQNLENGKGAKTVWIDEQDGGKECSVESMCLSEYRRLGWRGFHSEGGIITTLFAYLFFDVLFTYVPNVFQTPFQTCPLDLHTDAFYPTRAAEINRRLVEIANGDAERLLREVDSRERENKTSVIGLDWSFELEDLVEIACCFRGSALAMICKVMAQEYRHRGGGVPDLLLWDSPRKEVMFAEVKSVNDRLSDTQRLWIHVLISSGVAVEICYAVAKE